MKVLLIGDHPGGNSGYGKILLSIATRLKAKGHEPLIMGGNVGGYYDFQETDWRGFRSWAISAGPTEGSTYGNAEHVRWFLKHEKPDLVWTVPDPRFLEFLFQLDNEIRRQCPFVYYHLWDDIPFPHYNLAQYNSCDRIQAGSKFTYDLLVNNPATKHLNIDYCPLGINTDVYHPTSEEEKEKIRIQLKTIALKPIPMGFVIGAISRNAPRKNLLDLIRVFDKWSKDKPDAMFFLHLPERDLSVSLEYAVRQLYGDASVVLSTSQNNAEYPDDVINSFYNLFDVYINKSVAEGFGMPIAEAMAAGTPAISIDTQGPAGLITSENGWLLPADVQNVIGGDTTPFVTERYVTDATLIAALDEAYYNPELRKQKASKCRQFIIDNYSEQQMLDAVEKSLIQAVEQWKPYPSYTVASWPKEKVVNG